MNGGQAFVDSAYQGGSTQVFPNNYRSPDSIPHSTVTHVVVNTLPAATGFTFNATLAPVVQTPKEEIVAIQEIQPPQPSLPPLFSPVITPGAIAVPPVAADAVMIKPEPLMPLIELSPAQEAIRAPSPQQIELQAVTPLPILAPPLPALQTSSATVVGTPSPHVSVTAPTNIFTEKQVNPGAIQAPVASSETLLPSQNGIGVTTQPTIATTSSSTSSPDVIALSSQQGGIVRDAQSPLLLCDRNPKDIRCPKNAQADRPAFAMWIDSRVQTVDDTRGGINQHSRRRITTVGIDRLERDRLGFGISIGHQSESGTILNRFVQFDTTEYSLNPHISYRINPNWAAIGGVGYTQENISAAVLSLKGANVADHYSALVGGVGHYNLAGQWLSPSFFYNRSRIRSKEGSIQGVVAGTNVDLVTPVTLKSTEAVSAGVEWGMALPAKGGLRLTIQAKAIAHYDLAPSQAKPWSGDIRGGVRTYVDKMTTLEFGVSKLGLGRSGFDMKEFRVALIHGF
jgi:hypothetical protein